MSDFNVIDYHPVRAPRSNEVEDHSDRKMRRLDQMGYELMSCSHVSKWEQAHIKAWAKKQPGDVYVSNLLECNYDWCQHEDIRYIIDQEWCNVVGFYPYQRKSFEAMMKAIPKREHVVILPNNGNDIKRYQGAAQTMSKHTNVGLIHVSRDDNHEHFLFATFASKDDAIEFKMMA